MKTTTTLAILIACTALFALAGCEEADMQPPAEQSMYGGAEGSGELAAYSAQAKPHYGTYTPPRFTRAPEPPATAQGAPGRAAQHGN